MPDHNFRCFVDVLKRYRGKELSLLQLVASSADCLRPLKVRRLETTKTRTYTQALPLDMCIFNTLQDRDGILYDTYIICRGSRYVIYLQILVLYTLEYFFLIIFLKGLGLWETQTTSCAQLLKKRKTDEPQWSCPTS